MHDNRSVCCYNQWLDLQKGKGFLRDFFKIALEAAVTIWYDFVCDGMPGELRRTRTPLGGFNEDERAGEVRSGLLLDVSIPYRVNTAWPRPA